jgi:hypothetical protein
MKQTAVEWLINEIDMQYPEINVRRKEWMVDKAKEMENEQMRECYDNVFFNDSGNELNFEQYYNETYVENDKADSSRMDS